MNNDIVIKVENLSKLYRLGELHKQTHSFRQKVTNAFTRIALRSLRHALYTNSRYSNDLLTPSRKYGKKDAAKIYRRYDYNSHSHSKSSRASYWNVTVNYQTIRHITK